MTAVLTRNEKRIVAQYLASREGYSRVAWDMLPYIAPPTGFAAYALLKEDVYAMAFAFAVLLALAIWYLAYQTRASLLFLSALRKYEDTVRALERPDADPS
ncbi:MAG TPA: hypothetical protein PK264_05090 [Hyphomicrobiaceae bacterium]|nr:hypothetical protein [Hyphomicrobiaceae bacterium]